MRVVTWNINGVRTLPQYHPWNSFKTFDEILNHLDADIICFQEMKSSRQALPKHVALPPSFDSFFSFPIRKTGYSGTAIYTRRSCAVPLKAEEGLTGLIQPKPPLGPAERVSRVGTYPPDVGVRRAEDEDEDRDEEAEHTDRDSDDIDYKSLDSEGRAVVLDLGLFVLINTYCPNDGTGTEEREKFKMDFHRLLEARINGLIEEGREVMLVGDINACAGVEDHCEGQIMVDRGLAVGLEGDEGFWGKDSRKWMWDLLIHEEEDGGKGRGKMVDIVRKFWPDRKGMYTCWNTKISARDTNYGTRIDFILITPGLVPWIKAADIQPDIKGSDHCPVFVDFYDEITTSASSSSSAAADIATNANANANATTTTKLRDVLGARPIPATATDTDTESGAGEPQAAEPPRMAAKNWDEHKQFLLSNFFGKKAPGSGATPAPKPMFTLKPVAASASASAAPVPTKNSKSAASKPSPKSKSKSKSTPKPTPAVPPPRTKSSESASASETAMIVDDSPSPSGSLSQSHNREESSGSASTSAPASASTAMVVDPPSPSQSQAQTQLQAQVSVTTRSESESQSQQPLSSHSSSSTIPTAISATATLTPRPTLSKRKLALAAITVPSKKAKTSSSSSSSRVPKISPLSSSLQVPKETGTKVEAKTTKEKEKTGSAGLTSKSAITTEGRGKTADATSSTTIATASSSSSSAGTPIDVDVDVDEDADYRLALLLSQSDDNVTPLSLPSSSQQNQGSPQGTARPEQGKLKLKEKANGNAHEKEKERESKQAWTALLAPTQAPLCFVHQEPAKEYTVNKPGPNKGKKFFICSRPVGPGYDKGRAERLREQVDPQYKCDFFKWSSDVRKEMARKSKPNSNGNGNGNGSASA